MSIFALVALVVVIVLALAIYPGELSWLAPGGNRWLYDRGASSYEGKWQRHDYGPYKSLVSESAAAVTHLGERVRVADLACGTGIATRTASRHLPGDTEYVGVDYSSRMLQRFQSHIDDCPALGALDLTLVCEDLETWLRTIPGRFQLVMLMEASEFLPSFPDSLPFLGRVCEPGGRLIMTRPAGFWSCFFPGRQQSRRALGRSLRDAGFVDIRFIPWRGRYELVSATRAGD